MQATDATTLLLVNAAFNGCAALGWSLLAGVFKMAPRASWLMAAAHLSRVLTLACSGATADWPVWAEDIFLELAGLSTVSLLTLALRRLLRLGQSRADIGWVTAATALGIVAAGLLPRSHGTLIPLSAGMALLGMLATRDVISGAGPGLARWFTALLALPYLLLTLSSTARLVVLLAAPTQDPMVAQGRYASPLLGWVWLVLTMAVSVSLMGLLISRLIARIEHLTLRDTMTDTLNRRAIGTEMQTLQALRDRGHAFAVVLVDIDHFKRINDLFGHAAGDAALLHFVAVLRTCLRELDRLGRLGGEEFCVLLPHTTLAAAVRVAERMREALQARPLMWREQALVLTASFGVVPGRGGDPQGEAVLALADREVYRAKSEGRNRVCVLQEALS